MGRGFEWDIVTVLGSSVDADGFPSVQDDGDGDTASPPMQAHHFHGSWGMPLDPVVSNDNSGAPDPARSAVSLRALEGGVGHQWPLEDPRLVGTLPTPLPGEHITYGGSIREGVAGACFSRHHADGSISHATTDAGGQPQGQTVAEWIRPTYFARFAPWGREKFDRTGYSIKHCGGAKFSLRWIGGLPGPFGGGQSVARLQADIIELNASAVSIGPTGAIGQPVAQAAPLVGVLSTIAASLQTIAAALASANSSSGITSVQTSAVAAAVATASAAVGTALVTISSQSAIG